MATVILFSNTQSDHENYFTNSLLSAQCVLGAALSPANELANKLHLKTKMRPWPTWKLCPNDKLNI